MRQDRGSGIQRQGARALHVLDSRALPELSWEESCEAWRSARRMLATWVAQLADSELGREVRYLDLDLLALFSEELMALAYPALSTCLRLDAVANRTLKQIILWNDGSLVSHTIQSYAQAHRIPLTVRNHWASPAWLRQRVKRIKLVGRLSPYARSARRYALDTCLRWQNRSVARPARAGTGILALLGQGTYATSALPVLDVLRPSSRIWIVPLDYKAGRFFARRGWPSQILTDYVPDSRRSVVHQAQRHLPRIAQQLLRAPGFLAPFRHKTVDLAPVAHPFLQSLLRIQLPRVIPIVEGLQTLIQRERPHIILSVPDRNWRSQAAIELGRRFNIPSLTLQAGVISDHSRYDTIVADREAVMGESSRRLWEAHGIPREKLIVTGAPRFDAQYRLDPNASRRVRAALSIPVNKPLITFATQPLLPAVIEQNLRCVVQAAHWFPDYHFVCKVHPRETPARYSKLLRRLGDDKITVVQKIDLDALLQTSALVVTAFSTVALEAMLFERPVLIINLTGDPDPVDYVSSGAALGAYTPEEVVQQMRRLLHRDDPVHVTLAQGRRQYLADQLYKIDGQATRRVVELIDQMISSAETETR